MSSRHHVIKSSRHYYDTISSLFSYVLTMNSSCFHHFSSIMLSTSSSNRSLSCYHSTPQKHLLDNDHSSRPDHFLSIAPASVHQSSIMNMKTTSMSKSSRSSYLYWLVIRESIITPSWAEPNQTANHISFTAQLFSVDCKCQLHFHQSSIHITVLRPLSWYSLVESSAKDSYSALLPFLLSLSPLS